MRPDDGGAVTARLVGTFFVLGKVVEIHHMNKLEGRVIDCGLVIYGPAKRLSHMPRDPIQKFFQERFQDIRVTVCSVAVEGEISSRDFNATFVAFI